uniref:Uncharacterized protein n=1 Tax=Rhizophora mucronata TaxID=61149 RepID=A0A2P2QY87_RHIMU
MLKNFSNFMLKGWTENCQTEMKIFPTETKVHEFTRYPTQSSR